MMVAFAATVTEFLRRLARHLSSSAVLQLLGSLNDRPPDYGAG
jgi:hypothetical protein